jgi:hypothetical protein
MKGQEKSLYDMTANTIETALFNPNKKTARTQMWVACGMMGALGILVRTRLQAEHPEMDADLITEFEEVDYVQLDRRWERVAYEIGGM